MFLFLTVYGGLTLKQLLLSQPLTILPVPLGGNMALIFEHYYMCVIIMLYLKFSIVLSY